MQEQIFVSGIERLGSRSTSSGVKGVQETLSSEGGRRRNISR
jgi:hypothetical protein